MELVESHLILKKLPAEFWLIVNIGNFLDWVGASCVEPPGNGSSAVPQFLEECRRDGKEVHACECLNLPNLSEIRGISVTSAGA